MGKPTGGRSRTGQVSRSGLWLIGGTLLLSIVVLAWAFQEEPTASSSAGRRPGTPAASTRGGAAVRIEPEIEAGRVAQAPTLADYGPLLQRNVFRPLVVPEGAGPVSIGRGARSSSEGRVARSARGDEAEASGPERTDTWRGWTFNGVAQLDETTYALMDQTGKKVSRFVQPGDKLEDATVAQVADGEVTLREAGGQIVRVQRVDAMAALLRPSRSGPRSPRSPAAPAAAPNQAPASPGTRSAPVVTTPPNPETPRGGSPTSSALEERRDERREARRALRQERREAGRLEAGENPAVSED